MSAGAMTQPKSALPQTLLAFEDHGDHVRATFRPTDGNGPEVQVRARYLVGADGPRSLVRHQLGIGYEGATVRLLEEATAMSRGAIFHHFRDKDALFFALAEEDGDLEAALTPRS